ncbi:MAG: hypothetical protein OEV91_09590, partial [Desulfobulbaceae bacterium]|nr:hypothetical protein [Desulfobulbaceae bacterium]
PSGPKTRMFMRCSFGENLWGGSYGQFWFENESRNGGGYAKEGAGPSPVAVVGGLGDGRMDMAVKTNCCALNVTYHPSKPTNYKPIAGQCQ